MCTFTVQLSAEGNCMNVIFQVPEDALDLALSTVYVHSKDTLVPKVYVTMQPETLGKKTWRVLKNEIEVIINNQ